MDSKTTIDDVKKILLNHNFQIVSENNLQNGRGIQIKLVNGGVVNVYATGTVDIQGKEPARSLLRSLLPIKNAEATQPYAKAPSAPPKNVFIVYGY